MFVMFARLIFLIAPLHCTPMMMMMIIMMMMVKMIMMMMMVVLLVSCSTWQQLGVRANGAELSDFTASCATCCKL